MEELVPILLGAVLGAFALRWRPGILRGVLLAAAVALGALVATVLSGEAAVSWVYVLLDAGLAMLGVVGAAIMGRVLAARRQATEPRV